MFFGNAEQFLFTFRDNLKEPEMFLFDFEATGQQHQYADETCIGVGGSYKKGKFALSVRSDLYNGNS